MDRGGSCTLPLLAVLTCKPVTDGLDKRPSMHVFQACTADGINASNIHSLFAKHGFMTVTGCSDIGIDHCLLTWGKC